MPSTRSIRTGVGSRGGHGHRHSDDPAAWRERNRAWKAANPQYRERDNERRREARRQAKLRREREQIDLTAPIAQPLEDEPARVWIARWVDAQMTALGYTFRDIADLTGLDHANLYRLRKNQRRNPTLHTINELARVFGYEIAVVRRDQKDADTSARLTPALATRHPSNPA